MKSVYEKSDRQCQLIIQETCAQAEQALNISFADVTVLRKSAATLRALGVAMGSQIVLASELAYATDDTFKFVLAHELAHVAQKRLGSFGFTSAHPSALEHEADVAATSILAGRRVSIRLADAPDRPAHYNYLGHFYTVYYMMLKAGMNQIDAELRAFMCQLPDEVFQFDACAATRDNYEPAPADLDYKGSWAQDKLSEIGDQLLIQRSTPAREFSYVVESFIEDEDSCIPRLREDPRTQKIRIHRNRMAIEGLHCLTANDSSVETDYRLGNLLQNWNDRLISGLALHPFGDSFSHRVIKDEDHMYGPGVGHAADGHHPDYVRERPELYLEYCRVLYEWIPGSPGNNDTKSFDKLIKPDIERVLGIEPSPKIKPILEGHKGEFDAERVMVKLLKDMNAMPEYLYKPIGFESEEQHPSQLYWNVFSTHGRAAELIAVLGGRDIVFNKVIETGKSWL